MSRVTHTATEIEVSIASSDVEGGYISFMVGNPEYIKGKPSIRYEDPPEPEEMYYDYIYLKTDPARTNLVEFLDKSCIDEIEEILFLLYRD